MRHEALGIRHEVGKMKYAMNEWQGRFRRRGVGIQEWAGHANISTTRMYYKLRKKVEDSPSFKVRY